MSPAPAAPPASAPPTGADTAASRSTLSRNFLTLAAAQITMRVGWIFKTESVVIPAALDTLNGSGWVRGMLPLLSRCGLSLAPVLCAPAIQRSPLKKRLIARLTLGMSMCMGLIACVWLDEGRWLPENGHVFAFLLFYAVFFLCQGVNQVAAGTLRGKVIPPNRRGRLITVATMIGSGCAITAVALLMPRWLSDSRPRFELVFAWSAALFAVAALVILRVREMPDGQPATAAALDGHSVLTVIRRDRDFRVTLLVAMFTSCAIALFPHYQAIAREKLHLPLGNVVIWVIVQNIGVAFFSALAGPVADRHGNRIVLRWLTAGMACVPIIALAMIQWPLWGEWLYPLVFVGLGLTPIALRIMQNYTLEITSSDQHARYLSILALCSAAPVLLSPVVGVLVDVIGFEVALLTVAVLVGCGWVSTYFLIEPRGKTDVTMDEPPLLV